MKHLLSTMVLCTAAYSGFPADAADNFGRIQGIVLDRADDGSLSNATVHASNATRDYVAIADLDGRFQLIVVPGTYSVAAARLGYRQDALIEATVSADDNMELQIYMEVSPVFMDRLVITASRRLEKILDAPTAISKIDGPDLVRDANSSSYASTIRNVPGVDHQQLGLLQERYNARGHNRPLNNRLVLLTDGRLTAMSSGSPLYASPVTRDDLESIEVITGPGSALYGPDALAGVVSLTTKDPRARPGTSLSVAAGSRDQAKARFWYADATENWGWKVFGGYQQARDYKVIYQFFNADSTASVTDEPDFDASFVQGGTRFSYYPTHESSVSFGLGVLEIDQLVQTGFLGRIQGLNYRYHYQQVSYETPKLFFHIYRAGDDSGDGFSLESLANFRLAGVPTNVARELATVDSDGSIWEAEGRYHIDLPEQTRTDLTMGSSVRKQSADGAFYANGSASAVLAGFYGHLTTYLSQQITLVLATRVDVHEVYDTQFNPKTALIYKPTPEMAFRLSVNRAFESPSLLAQNGLIPFGPGVMYRGNRRGFDFANVSGNPLSSSYSAGIAQLQPVANTTIEAGFKGNFLGHLSFGITGFRSSSKNFFSPTLPIGNALSGIVTVDENGVPRAEQTLTIYNFGKQTAYGLDAAVSTMPIDKVLLTGNLSAIEAGSVKDASGWDVPFNTPGVIWNIGILTFDNFRKGTYLQLHARYVSEYDYQDGLSLGALPSYATVDLGAGMSSGFGIAYRLSLRNLLNNRHREFVTGPKLGRIAMVEITYRL